MKKVLKMISVLLLVCCVATIFAACASREHDAIKKAYAKLYKVDRSKIDFMCFAEFDGAHVLMFNGVYPDALSEEVVDGVVFHHSQIKTFDVYKDGEFYTLQEAFDQGLVTHDDLVKLRDVYNPPYADYA